MPVRAQFIVTELTAAGKQADLETERLRLKAAKSVVELAREKTPPPPPPPLKQSSEQLNSLTLRFALGKRAQEICRSFEV